MSVKKKQMEEGEKEYMLQNIGPVIWYRRRWMT